jgi:hypothetical protein
MTILNGCVAIQPFPNYARSGDTITLAVGSQDGMTRINTQAWFTSDASPANEIDITQNIRSIFKLYADRTSQMYSPDHGNADINFRYLHHEQWQTVIALDMPQGLPVGPGTVRVETAASQPQPLETGIFGPYPDVNTVSIRVEILPGIGSSNPLQYKTTYGGTLNGSYTDLQPARQALVKPPVEDPQSNWTTTYGAIELKVNLPMADVNTGTLTENNLRVVTQEVSNYTRSKLQTTWSLNGNVLTVLFISANGKIQYYEPRFSVVAQSADFSATPTLLSVSYFDVNGNVAAGPALADYSVSLAGISFY